MGKTFLQKIGMQKVGTETTPAATTAKKTVGPSSITSIHTPSSALLTEETTQLGGTSRADIVEYFKKVLAENNIPGPDYLEFVTALDSLKSAPLDDRTKFTTIFAGFKAQNVTPVHLIETAKSYIKLLGQKKQAFQTEATQHFAEKDAAQKALIAENAKIDKQMQELAAKKLDNDNKYKTLGTEKEEVNKNKTDFENTCASMVGEIEHNITLIDQYLGAGASVTTPA